MLFTLEGTVEFKGEKFIALNVGGVGYRVFLGSETAAKVPEKGGSVKLWIFQYIREDANDLYGFLSYGELELFETLNKISGIGPRTALGVMDIAPIDTLRKAIASGDTTYLTKVSGIGRKTAERIILELKEKFAGTGVLVGGGTLQEEADVLDALVSLGYSQREARDALGKVSADIRGAERRIREALKNLGKAQ